jgi:hypothetical protein
LRVDTFWLKALGGGPRVARMPDDWRSVGNSLFERAVTFAQEPSIEPGDKIVLYAAGWGAFFALGSAESYPYTADGDDPWKWRVDFKVEHAVPAIHDGLPLQVLNVDGRDLRVSMKRRSHLRLSEAEYDAAVEALVEKERSIRRRATPS